MNGFPWLTLLTVIPLAGGFLVLLAGKRSRSLPRLLAAGSTVLALALTIYLGCIFNAASGTLQLQELHAWVPALGMSYHLGMDGLSLLLLLLSAMVALMAIAASWQVAERPGLYFALVLFLEAGLFGTFTALNFVHWFFFWELTLIPAFFLVRLWGGPGRVRAANQFFLYTMVGSIALLLAFLAIFVAVRQFDFIALAQMAHQGLLLPAFAQNLHWGAGAGGSAAIWIFCGAFLGFAVKVPIFPFHAWMPSTYAEAPAGTTMLLTGAMSKMGLYGLLRILLPIFPGQMQRLLTPLLWLAVASIVVSAFTAWAQKDLKRTFAYSSMNHLGYCVLGVLAVVKTTEATAALNFDKAAALDGVFLQIFNHALTAATLFWFIALLERRSGGSRGLNDFGGLRKVVPVFCGLMGIAIFSSLGLPGLNGFIGEFLIFKGAFPLVTWATALSVLGLLMTAVFLLTVLERVFYGPPRERWSAMPDLTVAERFLLAPPLALMFVLGIYPRLFLHFVNSTGLQLIAQLWSRG